VGPRAGMERSGRTRPHRESKPDRTARRKAAIPTDLMGPNLIYKYSPLISSHSNGCREYRGADKYLARIWKETSYRDQDLRPGNKSNIMLLL